VFDYDSDEFYQKQSDQGFVEISVSDTGIGIPEQDLTKVFDRFFQSEAREEQTGISRKQSGFYKGNHESRQFRC
jgi:signal transduction histidine kinase